MAAVPNETGKESEKSKPGEVCGRCGAQIAQDSEVCSACGALLSAYRTPVVTADDVPIPTEGNSYPQPVRSEPLPRTPFRLAENGPSPVESLPASDIESPSELAEVRADLLSTMLNPERRFVAALQPEVLPANPVVAVALPPPERRTVTPVAPAPATVHSLAKSTVRRSGEPRPRKPGFVSIGSIEPVLMIGSGIFVLAVIVGLVSSFGIFRLGSIVALVLGTIGVFTIIFAMLVALVRKDQNRR